MKEFRIWDEKHKKMVYFTLIKLIDNYLAEHIDYHGDFFKCFQQVYNPKNIMQYSEVEDSHSKKIYVGDKVIYAGNDAIIVFEDSAFRVKYKGCGTTFTPVLSKNIKRQITVVGNIYEDKEI